MTRLMALNFLIFWSVFFISLVFINKWIYKFMNGKDLTFIQSSGFIFILMCCFTVISMYLEWIGK